MNGITYARTPRRAGPRGIAVRITFIEPAPPGFHIYSFIKQVRLGPAPDGDNAP